MAMPTKFYGDLQLPELTVTSAENSRQLEKRFAFLWGAAHRLLPSNAALANHLLATMMQLARSSRAQLPQAVLDFICEACGGLLLPSVSCDVRVVPQNRKSPANRRLARQQRRAQQQNGTGAPRIVREALTTLVRVTCHRCQHANDRPGASVVHKAKTKKRSRDEEDSAPDRKRQKIEESVDAKGEAQNGTARSGLASTVASIEEVEPTSMFAPPPPPSPPRKLLDGPKKRKKKKQAAKPDAAVTAVKSNLNSFLLSLKPSSQK